MKSISCAWIHVIAYTKAAAIPIPYSKGEQASEQRGRQDSLARPLLSRYAIAPHEPRSQETKSKAEEEAKAYLSISHRLPASFCSALRSEIATRAGPIHIRERKRRAAGIMRREFILAFPKGCFPFMCVSNQNELDVSSISFVTCVTLVCTLHFCRFLHRFRRASKRASSVAGTTVKGASFTFAGVCEKQGSIVGVCVKLLCFFGFGR